ncbi:uncharacterized protein RCC_05237 [Ramularia collo-cygni]|uniref:Uncharacterized protein n=1 Tax=Ramularia collo-cygni TaxID=112498 RepID=A0A2D3UVS6_9PEZI|nr:uncharacterized protein RCC_05237 [Ramularia collo-cygni]CZT19388.1 uncharacterized protein RCC_05237 [Ramularia collo-cygni]
MSNSKPTMMTMPREIRDCIYEFVWSSSVRVRVARRSFPQEPQDRNLKVSGVGLTRDVCKSSQNVESQHASLLLVNRQILAEAMPIFYRRSTIVLNMDGSRSMRYLREFDNVARANITSLEMSIDLLYDKHVPPSRAWSGDKEKPLYEKDGLVLITPFATLMAETLPRLSEVFFHVPVGGSATFYCGWATRELHMLLKYGRIRKLNHVFDGKHAVNMAEAFEPQECYERLMGPLADGRQLAEHEFELRSPLICATQSDPAKNRRAQQWYQAREDFVAKHGRPFAWEWGDCGVDANLRQPIKVVIACSRPASTRL